MGWISIIITIIFVCLMGFLFYDYFQIDDVSKQFCEDNGYESRIISGCYKIEGNDYITKEVKVVDGKAYWVVRDG